MQAIAVGLTGGSNLRKRIAKLTRIGLALSVEKDTNRLLEMIVREAKALCRADAGTIYTLDQKNKQLRFAIVQNNTMPVGLETGNRQTVLPNVELYINGRPNYTNVSSYVALTGKTVHIDDVYQADGFDFTGTRLYDASTGYRSKSMLVIPMLNHEDKVIGVLQLLNAKDPDTGQVVGFLEEDMDMVASLASQAAVALTNAQLINNLRELFYSFIKSIATAIDEKSPYTGGHIRRVVELCMLMAETINSTTDGPLADVRLNASQMEELRIAAWMHDVGKITTPEYIVDKATKLETLFDRIELVKTRSALIKTVLENKALRRRLEAMGDPEAKTAGLDKETTHSLEKNLDLVIRCNQPTYRMSDQEARDLERLTKPLTEFHGWPLAILTEDEASNLQVRFGTLTAEERRIIENHVVMTKRILEQLPFPAHLANVARYAACHHERLNGSGYPEGLAGESLPLPARIMAIADIFEALTAKDRPYKNPLKLSQALNIMEEMKNKGHIDPDIYDLFVTGKVFAVYARREMQPEQIDI